MSRRALAGEVRDVARGWRWGSPAPRPAGWQRREFPTAWARSPAGLAARGAILDGIFRPLLAAEVTGVTHVDPRLGATRRPVVLVANHASHLDTPLVLTALPRPLRERTVVVAAADYFFGAAWRAVGTALAFGTVPIERRGGTPSRTPGRLLESGWSLLMFPEGTRSPDGQLGPFRTGAARLALAAGAPLVPVAIRGTYAAMPRGRSWPLPGRPVVHLRLGAPLAALPGEDAAGLTLRARREVARLLDEDAGDWWSSLRVADDELPAPGPRSAQLPSAAGDAAAQPARWRRVWGNTEPLVRPGPPRAWR